MFASFLVLLVQSTDAMVFREAEAADDAAETGGYSGLLTPDLPAESAITDSLLVQTGMYDATFLRIRMCKETGGGGVNDDSEESADEEAPGNWYAGTPRKLHECRSVEEVEAKLKQEEERKGSAERASSLFVCMEEGYVRNTELTMSLLKNKFAFHHYHPHPPAEGQLGELCYYKWVQGKGPTATPDLVPNYATSIEGTGVIVYRGEAPNRQVLLVWEYGQWKFPGGAVDIAESKLVTGPREVLEEVGVKIDLSGVKYCGGWNIGKARDRSVNDNFSCFAAPVYDGQEVQVDNREISNGDAAWLDEAQVRRLVRTTAFTEALEAGEYRFDFTAAFEKACSARKPFDGFCVGEAGCAVEDLVCRETPRAQGHAVAFLWLKNFLGRELDETIKEIVALAPGEGLDTKKKDLYRILEKSGAAGGGLPVHIRAEDKEGLFKATTGVYTYVYW